MADETITRRVTLCHECMCVWEYGEHHEPERLAMLEALSDECPDMTFNRELTTDDDDFPMHDDCVMCGESLVLEDVAYELVVWDEDD